MLNIELKIHMPLKNMTHFKYFTSFRLLLACLLYQFLVNQLHPDCHCSDISLVSVVSSYSSLSSYVIWFALDYYSVISWGHNQTGFQISKSSSSSNLDRCILYLTCFYYWIHFITCLYKLKWNAQTIEKQQNRKRQLLLSLWNEIFSTVMMIYTI